jgi:hypothetical protein
MEQGDTEMRRCRKWAAWLAALLLAAACRPSVETNGPDPAEEADLGVCQTGQEECTDDVASEPAATETVSPTVPPTPMPTATTRVDESLAEQPDDLLAVRDTDWVMGADDALLTLIEYGDFL